jgi:spore germination cell wall hydrolase CwlJ-like protein
MTKIIQIIVALIALTVTQLGHAETSEQSGNEVKIASSSFDYQDLVETLKRPFVDFAYSSKDVECLARNIFFEAGSEPEEGKAAVGIVTINRVKNHFASSICQVVNQRAQFTHTRTETSVHEIKRNWYSKPEQVKTTKIVFTKTAICQFSWTCERHKKSVQSDQRWEESHRVAEQLLDNGYPDLTDKYSSAMYFHATRIRPSWAKQKHVVAKVGGHIFYEDKQM